MSKKKRRENKCTVYLEDEVHNALAEYASLTNKSLSVVMNDAIKKALITPEPENNADTFTRHVEQIQEQLVDRDESVREALRTLQEMLGLFVRMYLNRTPLPESGSRAMAAGRQQFTRFITAVKDSVQPGCSILTDHGEPNDGGQ